MMSQHIVEQEKTKFMFGWDQPLLSFYLQVHDLTQPEDDQLIIMMGADRETRMYEVEDLVVQSRKVGLTIDYPTQVKLYGEKDDGV